MPWWRHGDHATGDAAFLTYCFDQLDAHRIEPKNIASVRLAERLGLACERQMLSASSPAPSAAPHCHGQPLWHQRLAALRWGRPYHGSLPSSRMPAASREASM